MAGIKKAREIVFVMLAYFLLKRPFVNKILYVKKFKLSRKRKIFLFRLYSHMYRPVSLPRLPWFNFDDKKVGCERWHRSTTLDLLNGTIPYSVEQRAPQTVGNKPFYWDPTPGKYPPLYPTKDQPELPSWIIFDKQVLCFEAYFHETPMESLVPIQVRRVKIIYFLEDGTVQVNEAKIDNSGLPQGTIIRRQRIPLPRPNEKAYHEIIDFNIRKDVVLFGRTFHIINCDKFTRQWLNRAGIAVPDPLPPPHDPFVDELKRRKAALSGKKKCAPRDDRYRQFLNFDRHVLRFNGYWDDRTSEGGDIHKIVVQYYLADDTVDLREEGGGFVLARSRLPKFPATCALPPPGATQPVTILNILEKRVVADPLNIGASTIEYYKDNDFSIGTVINVYGRAIVLTSCDLFTKEYYRAKYGLDTFGEPIPLPGELQKKKCLEPTAKRDLPPWNGFGTFEDSARNCVKITPKRDDMPAVAKKLANTSNGLESRILRYCATLVPEVTEQKGKHFIVCFYIADDTVSIYQVAARNSGFNSGKLFHRREAWKTRVSDLFVARKPATLNKEDFWVGNLITIENEMYQLIEADEYTLSYMEKNNQEFPKSNIDLILPKIREKLRPIYKAFTCKYLLPDGVSLISHHQLWTALRELLGDDFTPQEMLTVARHFAVAPPEDGVPKCTLREICRNECRRLLFTGQERLAENLRYRDMRGNGYLSENEVYSICRGAKVPLDSVVIKLILNKLDRNEDGEVCINDLLTFFDPAGLPTATFIPFSHLKEFSEMSLAAKRTEYSMVDSFKLLESLNLEDNLKKES